MGPSQQKHTNHSCPGFALNSIKPAIAKFTVSWFTNYCPKTHFLFGKLEASTCEESLPGSSSRYLGSCDFN